MLQRHSLLFALAAVSAFAPPTWALFEVKDPLSKMYNVESKSVYAGAISAYDADSHILTVKPFTLYKGAALPAQALRIEIKSPEALWSEIHVGNPIVLFQGPRAVAFHVADHWYAGQVLGKPNIFLINTRIGRPAHTAHDESFPGTTEELLHALDELKTGKSTLLDKFPDKLFPAPIKEKFNLPANAAAFAALLLTDKKLPTYFVADAGGLKALQLNADGQLHDITSSLGLANIKVKTLAAANIAGKPTLLLDHALWIFNGKIFTRSGEIPLFQEKTLAVALGDFSDQAQPDLAILTDKDLLRIPLAEVMALPSANSPPFPELANGERLTGTLLTDFHPAHKAGFGDHAALAAVDLNNDHRPDLVILTPAGTLTLLNRNFGGFLVNKDDAAPLLDPAATGKPQLPLLASTPDTLYLLEKDGALYRYNFPAK